MSNQTMILNKILEAPIPGKIQAIDFTDKDCVRFSWRGIRFRVDENCFVEEVQKAVLVSSPIADLMKVLIFRV